MNERTGIGELKGIGEKTEKLFHRLGVYTVGDLLRHYPRGYDIYEAPVPIDDLTEGRIQTVSGLLSGTVQVSPNRKMPVTTVKVKDASGTIKAIWFRMPFLRSTLAAGGPIILRGHVVRRKDGLIFEHPEIFYPADSYQQKMGTLQPQYPLTTGLSNNLTVKAVRQAVEQLNLTTDRLPEELRMKYELAEYNYAIRGIHFPEDKEVYCRARERLVFEEFLEFILSIRKLKENNERMKNDFDIMPRKETDRLLRSLPYELTGAQMRVWKEIMQDMQGEYVMSRLVQGDVGSGKTIVAALALLTVVMNGYQGAMMAPTEVLAKQHFESLTELFDTCHISIKTKEKREAYARIASGESQIILGTHALIQDKVDYHNLALVVTDEQHRFGVRQRELFAEKGTNPHILVMSATPIPRTLAIILYGDLDISIIDELPSNRLPIKNCVVDTGYREKAYAFIRKQVEQGRQAYVICPMVEASEMIEAENVLDYSARLKEALPGICVEYLHGKMKGKEKNQIT